MNSRIRDEEDSQGGSGSSGGLEFHDFLSEKKSDRLSPAEERTKRLEHSNKNRNNLAKALAKVKELREKRSQDKNLTGMQGDKQSEYKFHPILSKKQQFDGIDPKINLSPNLNTAETNSEKKAELTYQRKLQLQLQQQNKFVPPKPTPM